MIVSFPGFPNKRNFFDPVAVFWAAIFAAMIEALRYLWIRRTNFTFTLTKSSYHCFLLLYSMALYLATIYFGITVGISTAPFVIPATTAAFIGMIAVVLKENAELRQSLILKLNDFVSRRNRAAL